MFVERLYAKHEKKYDHYTNNFQDFASFRQVFKKLTENNHCMVIDKLQRSNVDLFDNIYFYSIIINDSNQSIDMSKSYDESDDENYFIDYEKYLLTRRNARNKNQGKIEKSCELVSAEVQSASANCLSIFTNFRAPWIKY